MNKIELSFHTGFEWVTSGRVTFKGYLFDKQGVFLNALEAVQLFQSIDGNQALEKILQQLDGIFTLVIDLPDGSLIATDPIGAFPLFYTKTNGSWTVRDDASGFSDPKNTWVFNTDAQPEFLSAGFVLGDETLIRDISRTQAGEIIFLYHDGKKEKKSYYWFLPNYFTNKKKELLKQEFKAVLQSISGRLIESLQGKTAVIPLSGGYDSRLIACMLKKAGYETCICFTYGRPNKEAEISKKVANALGFKWFFIDYNDLDIKGLTEDPFFIDYCNYAGGISSMPYLQEYFAVKHLKEHKLIPDDSIFIPGHTGDYIAGSYLEKTIRKSYGKTGNSSRDIRERYFNFLPLSPRQSQMIENRVEQWFDNYFHPDYVADTSYDAITEDWDLKEKFSKFIFNSASVFPFFGYQFRLPLWDAGFRSFFRKLPFSLRRYKVFYDEVILEEYFIPAQVYFDQDELNKKPSPFLRKKFRDKLRFLVPYSIRKNRLRKRDYLCYHRFTGKMKKNLVANGEKLPRRINNYNALICLWYSYQIKRRLTNGNKAE